MLVRLAAGEVECASQYEPFSCELSTRGTHCHCMDNVNETTKNGRDSWQRYT